MIEPLDRSAAQTDCQVQVAFAMNILHVVPTYYPAVRYGGPIWSVHGLASSLAARGHKVHVYTTNVDGERTLPVPVGRPVQIDGVTVWYFRTGFGRRLYRSPTMDQKLEENVKHFDIVHLHSVFLWPTSSAARAARAAGVPYVLSPRGMLVTDLIHRKNFFAKRAWINFFERRNIEKAAAVHVTSNVEASELQAFRFRCTRTEIVANGIERSDDESFESNSRADFGIAGRYPDPYVLFLGRINWKKGLDRIIPAMEYVPGVRLLIAGNDEENYRSKLEVLARRFGVIDRIHFLGPVHGKRKWELLESARLLALPSYSENFGNVVLEAMAVGCPVIVTPEVGIANIVLEVGCGVVCSGEPECLGAEIRDLFLDHERRQTMAQAGRHAVKHHFSWRAIGDRMLNLYTEVLADRSNGPGEPCKDQSTA
jgi:glycosyltransferase involved in cell wall biosynthesis